MLKKLAAFLGFLCLVLLLLAFDEGQVERGARVVRDRVEPAVARLRDVPIALPKLPNLPGRPGGAAPAPAAVAPGSRAIVGAFAAPEDQPGGDLRFDAAVLTFSAAPALRTRPHRIALGRDPVAEGLGVRADVQVELRQVVPLDARTPPAASPLCGGAVPGWLAVARDGRGLRLKLWPAGPAPETAGAAPCGVLTYEGARG